MNTDTQKPSEHAIDAAQLFYQGIAVALKEPASSVARDDEHTVDLACIIDQHAIAPAVAERDKRIAELEEALKPFARLASGGFAGTVWQDSWDERRDSTELSYDHANGNHTTLGDYRRAIEVLAKKGQP